MNLTDAKRRRRRNRSTAVRPSDAVELKGGLNLVDSAHRIKSGELLICLNYEPYFVTGAYRRTAGHEVFDGRLRPHLAEYWRLDLVGISGGPFVVGETIQGASSGATARVALYEPDDEAADNSGYLILSELTEEVDSEEQWSAATSGASGTGSSETQYQGQQDEDLHDAAQLAAENLRRAEIEKVGGSACSGPVRGVRIYNNEIYAFRDDSDGLFGTMWKAAGAGWSQVDLGIKIRFEAGQEPPEEGATLTGDTSGASCVVQRVVITSGWWSAGTAVGYVITTEVTSGPFTASEALEVGGTQLLTAAASDTQSNQSLPPGGKYRFRNTNFGGNTETFRMYGVNGVGNGFEFDGTVFTLIETGMALDRPSQIGVHRGHLLFCYPGGSVQHSGKNQPLSWQPVTGANELLAGDEITGIMEEVSDVTFVLTRNQTFRLEGFVQENIQLKLHNSETGGIEDTIQRIGRSIYLDDRGFTNLPTTNEFGDFSSSQIGFKIDPLVQNLLREARVRDSVVHRGKSLYRCFFSTREAIVFGFSGNRVNGITIIDYGIDVNCSDNGEIVVDGANSGEERVFLGSDDGFVYETDVGRNFNGEAIKYYIVPAYHLSRSPEHNKRYRRVTIYAEGQGRVTLTVYGDYNYNEDAQNFETIMDRSVPLGGGRYGISRHGEFVYSAASKTDIRVPMDSHGRNVSLIFFGEETNEEPHTLYAMTFHVSRRRLVRR